METWTKYAYLQAKKHIMIFLEDIFEIKFKVLTNTGMALNILMTFNHPVSTKEKSPAPLHGVANFILESSCLILRNQFYSLEGYTSNLQ